ncbi:MAG: PD40 domain-containing protein [Bacteroidetes bacterium]|nr:PD40 domain-containing protein [Bacteroidota bacterium]
MRFTGKLYWVFLLLIFYKSNAQFYYGHQMDFGKNRIQYQIFNWTYFDYERYRIYSYQGGAEIAKFASVSMRAQLPILEKKLDFQADDKINVLVYNNQGDFKQSNLGLSSEDQTNIGGTTRIIGDKMSVFFNGSHAEMNQQIRYALAELLINQYLYTGNAREMLRNSTLLNLPDWFTKGLAKYLSEGWNSYSDNLLYDALKNDHFNNLNKLTGTQAINAGYALWFYIIDSYGEAVIPNLLYMARVGRSPDNAMQYVLGLSMDNLVYDMSDSYNKRLLFQRDTSRKSPIKNNSLLKKYKQERHYYQLKISPDAKQAVYARTELNQIRVYVKDIETGKQKRILKYGPKVERIPDYNYPLIAWHPKGNIVAMIYEKKDQLIIHTIDLETKEVNKRNLPGFEKVNSFSYSNDGKRIAISAVKKGKGQSDIFVFGLNTSAIEQLTNDVWDDNNPVFVKGGKQIVFESNRENDTIKLNDDAQYFYHFNRNMDLFMSPYPFTTKNLVRVTNTPNINETQAQAYTKNYIVYLSDNNGIYNRHIAEFDSTISFVDTTEHYRYFFKDKIITNFDRNILEQNINNSATHIADVIYANGNDMLLITPIAKNLNEIEITQPKLTWFKSSSRTNLFDPSNYKTPKPVETTTPQKVQQPDNKGIDFDNYKFDGEKTNPSNQPKNNNIVKQQHKDSIIPKKQNTSLLKFPIQKNYYTSFYTDQVVTQFDNSFLNNQYQLFTGGQSPVFLNPGINFLTKLSASDLFEDQRIVGGFRINPSLDNEFMLSWEQRKRRFDHQILVDRQTFSNLGGYDPVGGAYQAKLNTHSARYSIRFPINEVMSVRYSLLYRNDRLMPLSNTDYGLSLNRTFQNMVGSRIEFIFDNTRKIMLNILNGFRFKTWAEYWKIYYPPYDRHDLITFGFDARHYQKVHRQITWCNRLAGGNSLGTDRLIFYLGGVDNWFLPRFNQNINIVHPEQYGFQTIATDMRGFTQNIRNGNNFLVYNTELRVPIVRYLFSTPFRSEFLNNFQTIGFFDLGMAWYGSNPISELNTQNVNSYVQQGTGTIINIINLKNPLVGGTGFGFRSKLFGYFVRLDFAWGIDNFKLQDRITYLSFATDF